MTYRVTATLGRPTLDLKQLEADELALLAHLPVGSQVTVDPVKAALVVTLAVSADGRHAVQVILWAAKALDAAFAAADVEGPGSIAHIEAEYVPPVVESAT